MKKQCFMVDKYMICKANKKSDRKATNKQTKGHFFVKERKQKHKKSNKILLHLDYL